MYLIEKILNHNSVLVHSKQGEQLIFLGKGIGFGKKVGTSIAFHDDMELFRFAPENDHGKASDIIDSVDPIFIEIAAKIVQQAQKVFSQVDTNILLPLADHIAFSIERMKQHMTMNNPFANEIRLLYSAEYEVAEKGREIIAQKSGFLISDDEVGYITLHIHAALSDDKVAQSMQAAIIVKEGIKKVEEEFQIHIDTNSMSYIRLMNHMKFLLLRLHTQEELHLDVSDFVEENYPYAYRTAQNICIKLEKAFQKPLPEEEIGYLALHIERIRTCEMKKQSSK